MHIVRHALQAVRRKFRCCHLARLLEQQLDLIDERFTRLLFLLQYDVLCLQRSEDLNKKAKQSQLLTISSLPAASESPVTRLPQSV